MVKLIITYNTCEEEANTLNLFKTHNETSAGLYEKYYDKYDDFGKETLSYYFEDEI